MSESPTWQELLELVEQLNNTDYENASVQFGKVSVRLSKSDAGFAASPTPIIPTATSPAQTSSTPAPVVETPVASVVHGETIDAPMIGVFYRRPSPGAEPFVQPGDRVEADTTIGIIEIMKLMNPVLAGKSGVLGEFLAEDAEAVEFGQPLVSITSN